MRAEPEIRQLRAFVAVVDEGGFTRGASALGISQSTISESIRGLERVLGAEVFVKGKRRPILTRAGARLLPDARRVLAVLDEAVHAVAEVEGAARATLRVGTTESISAYILPDVLAKLRRGWPGTRHEVSTDTCTAVRAGVRSGCIDLGLVLETESGAGEAESLRLAQGRLVLFARAGHPLAGKRVNIGTIADAMIFLSDAAGDFFGLLQRYIQGAGYAAHRLQSTGSVEGVKRGVMADPDALGLLPAHALDEELRQGTLVEVDVEPPLPSICLEAIWRQGTPLPARARTLVDGLRDLALARVAHPA